MRLFYFTSERFGLEAIRDKRLKLARISELNDPLEWLAAGGNKFDRKLLNRIKGDADQKYGLICMSEDWQHPLLWGHYADKHKGLCLGFDVTDNAQFRKVFYAAERISPAYFSKLADSTSESPSFIEHALTKFDGWEYEAEHRTLRKLSNKDPVSGLYFHEFSHDIQLTQVVVGAHSSVTRAKLKEVLGSLAPSVTCFKARPGFKKFEIVENKLQSAWK